MMTPQTWVLIAVAVLFAIEFAQGRHRGIHRLQDGLIIAASIASSFAIRPIVALATAFVIGLVLPQWRGALADLPAWSSFVVILLVGEFGQYWFHRLAHDSQRHRLLYGMHRTHHTAPYVNVTLLYRSNFCWGFVHPYVWVAAIAIYLGQVEAAATFLLSILLWNAVTHSDWRWDDTVIAKIPHGLRLIQAFELVFVTPRLHHAHHGYGHDGKPFRNFNTILTVFDRGFGTLYVPQGRPWRYGLPGGEHHWARQLLFPLMPLGVAPKRDRLGRPVT